MKIKELKKTVNVSWSPASHYPVMLATGSAGQQVDSSFSSNAYLELYSLSLNDPGYDMEVKCTLPCQQKFQKLAWSEAGILAGGCDGGLINFYSVERLLCGANDALVGSSTKHNGHVSALDVNPYQKNLLASGASDSEIYIWDLNNTNQPMAPGNKSQPYEHVQGLAWNQQVQHILASTFATRCVVWDLRKNEPIMKLSDAQYRSKWRSVVWHPNVATQLCVASEDDQVPVIQLWDLRLAASPLVTLEQHNKGVLGLSWCHQDSDLLLSAGKDGRVLCWNPNNTKPGGELISEVSSEGQWVFDVSWCPRNPCLVASSCFDGHVNVYSLNGGTKPDPFSNNRSNIMDSFGGADSFSQLPAVNATASVQSQRVSQQLLTRAPKWTKRPVGAKFAFGGKLITFEKAQETGEQKLVYISQVVSDPELVNRAQQLDVVLSSSNAQDMGTSDLLAEYCRQKGDNVSDQNERYTWFFLRANFLPDFRTEVLNLLGFKQDEIPSKFKGSSVISGHQSQHFDNNVDSITSGIAGLSRDTHTLIERKLANVDLVSTAKNVTIPNGEDMQSVICRALVCGNLEEAVELCLESKRVADALIIASLGSQELLYKVQKHYLNSTSQDPVSLLTRTLLLSGWGGLIGNTAASSWRETLAAIVTHCDNDSLAENCEKLGDKLTLENEAKVSEAATACYLCSMSAEALISRWSRSNPPTDSAALVRLTELALLTRRACQIRGRPLPAGGKLEHVLSDYALRLASQGCLQGALTSLEGVEKSEMRDRLLYSLRLAQPQHHRQSGQYRTNRTRTTSGQNQKRPHYSSHDNSHMTNPGVVQDMSGGVWQPHNVAPGPGLLQPTFGAPAPPQVQPPRPSSTGPLPGGVTSRSKYKVDPSVQAAPLYGQYSFNNPVQQPLQQGYGSYGANIPDQYSAASVPNPTSSYPNAQYQSPNPGLAPLNPVNPNQGLVNGTYYNPGQIAPEPPPTVAKPTPSGWNDPPAMSSNKQKLKADVPAQAPITHPLFGVEPPQHIPLAPVQPQYPGLPHYPGPPQYPEQQQYPGQPQYSQQTQYPGQMSPAYPQQAESPAPAEPIAAQKPPIPEEHLRVQTIFDSLRYQCTERATNPQMKRKLEDVQRRLENLYDMLREYRLTGSALESLHSCAGYTEGGRYEEALQVTTALATGSDFAEVASFLPGLKMLLQLASQLQVYIR